MRLTWMKTSTARACLIGIVLTLLEQTQGRGTGSCRRRRAMGIAMLIPFSAVTMIFVGAVADRIWELLDPESHERYSIAIASGLIAGEALVAVVIPLLVTLHLMKLPS